MKDSDQFIIRKCLDGRPDAFRHLVRRYQAPVTAHISKRLRRRHLVEEAAQETFVRAFFNLEKLRKPEKFYSWLLGIAARVSKEELRKNGKVINLEDISALPAETVNTDTDMELEQAVSRLEDPYRQVVLLRFYANRSCREISEALDVPVGTVTKQLSRAYEKLRGLLKEDNSIREVQK
jgi:RNA polymerase sigma-70 factor (ECF subfamily)